MKKFVFVVLIVLCMPLFLFVGCEQSDKNLNEYDIVAKFDDENMVLSCEQDVRYFNNTANVLTNLSFYLYANSFDVDQKPVSTAHINKAYPNGQSYGNITFNSVIVEGGQADYEIASPNANILTVELEKELFPNECVEICMDYEISLANINHRLGYGDNTINFGNFFPIACVYEDGVGFVENDFASNGDPFYSDVSDFNIELTFSSKYKVAATGNLTNETDYGDNKQVCFSAKKVRDFCFVLSKRFEVISQEVDGVKVSYFYYEDENAQQHLQTSVDALKTFETLFGDYPYKQLSIVKTNFCFGGMEYPNLVMISDEIDDVQTFDYVIVHEVAHQWWYSVVGNNQFSESWVDESLTEFSTFLFYEKNEQYGIDYDILIENATATYTNFVKIYSTIYGQVDQSMNRTLTEYDTEPEYVNCVYTKGVLMYDSLKGFLGKQKILKCMKDYFKAYAFQNVSGTELINSFSKSAHRNLKPFLDSWLGGEVVIN